MSNPKKAPAIDYVIDAKDNTKIDVVSFFDNEDSEVFKLRYKNVLDMKTGKALFKCGYCNQPLRISGGGKIIKSLFFKHLLNSQSCPAKRIENRTISKWGFDGGKEGETHKLIKNTIAEFLRLEQKVKVVVIDSIYKSSFYDSKNRKGTFRKPDVFVETITGKKVVFEIQLATTFLDTIVERDEFYRKEGIYVVWVFKSFNEKALSFTQKDIFYNHGCNAFVFDDEALKKSKEQGRLVFGCYYNLTSESGEINEGFEYISIGDFRTTNGLILYKK